MVYWKPEEPLSFFKRGPTGFCRECGENLLGDKDIRIASTLWSLRYAFHSLPRIYRHWYICMCSLHRILALLLCYRSVGIHSPMVLRVDYAEHLLSKMIMLVFVLRSYLHTLALQPHRFSIYIYREWLVSCCALFEAVLSIPTRNNTRLMKAAFSNRRSLRRYLHEHVDQEWINATK